MTAQALRRRPLPGGVGERREWGTSHRRSVIPAVRLPGESVVPQQTGRYCTMRRMTEGALAHGYRGAKMAPGSEVVDRSGNAPSRRLTSERPGVTSGQPHHRYRGYYKNRDLSDVCD